MVFLLTIRRCVVPVLAASCLTLAFSSCAVFRPRSDTVARLDKPRERPRKPVDRRTRRMVIAISTNPAGQIVDIQFRQSSGSEAVDNYVLETIKADWPGQAQPGTVTTVELTQSSDTGFSEPKVLSVQPLP